MQLGLEGGDLVEARFKVRSALAWILLGDQGLGSETNNILILAATSSVWVGRTGRLVNIGQRRTRGAVRMGTRFTCIVASEFLLVYRNNSHTYIVLVQLDDPLENRSRWPARPVLWLEDRLTIQSIGTRNRKNHVRPELDFRR